MPQGARASRLLHPIEFKSRCHQWSILVAIRSKNCGDPENRTNSKPVIARAGRRCRNDCSSIPPIPRRKTIGFITADLRGLLCAFNPRVRGLLQALRMAVKTYHSLRPVSFIIFVFFLCLCIYYHRSKRRISKLFPDKVIANIVVSQVTKNHYYRFHTVGRHFAFQWQFF